MSARPSRPVEPVGPATLSPSEQALAAALIELLAASPTALARLLELADARRPTLAVDPVPAYTVSSLAELLQVSPKVVRGAIARGELAAVKRGGRWIIAADAVHAWAHGGEPRRPRRHAGRCKDRPLGSAIALLPGANRVDRAL